MDTWAIVNLTKWEMLLECIVSGTDLDYSVFVTELGRVLQEIEQDLRNPLLVSYKFIVFLYLFDINLELYALAFQIKPFEWNDTLKQLRWRELLQVHTEDVLL